MRYFISNLKNNKYLFLITLSYFLLSFVNIHSALLALVCMLIPFILLFKNKKKTWCQGYCPRAGLYSTIGNAKSWSHRKTPKFFLQGRMKDILLFYFVINLAIIIMSTIIVAKGRSEPFDMARMFLFIPIGQLPQLFTLDAPGWLLHMSYRFFSMMLTTSSMGLVFALLYKPRTWCTVCPIATISDGYIKGIKRKAS